MNLQIIANGKNGVCVFVLCLARPARARARAVTFEDVTGEAQAFKMSEWKN